MLERHKQSPHLVSSVTQVLRLRDADAVDVELPAACPRHGPRDDDMGLVVDVRAVGVAAAAQGSAISRKQVGIVAARAATQRAPASRSVFDLAHG